MIAPLTLALLLTGTDQAALHAAAASTCAAFPLRKTGTIHYFCDCQAGSQAGCVAGDDANAGTSAAAPKRRWYAALQTFDSMNAGDTIALCRGGAWSLSTSTGNTVCGLPADPGSASDVGGAIANTRCGSAAPYTEAQLKDPANATTCDIRDYQADWGGSNKPLLSMPASATSSSILARSDGTLSGVRILNLEFRGAGVGNGGPDYGQRGFFHGSCGSSPQDDDWLIGNVTFYGLTRAMHLNENSRFSTRRILWGNRFLWSTLDAILGGPGNYGKVDANFFDNNGGPNRIHTVYFGSFPQYETVGASMVNNEFRRSAATASASTPPGPCLSPVMQTHDRYDGLLIENNLIDGGNFMGGGCYGISLTSGGSNATDIKNAVVRRNWVSVSGAVLELGQVSGAIVENNVLIDTTSSSSKATIMVPGNFQDRAQDGATTRNTIRNNTLYVTGSSDGIRAIEFAATSVGTGNVVANNAIVLGGARSPCFNLLAPSSAFAFVGNNACYQGTWGTTYDATAHLTMDPLFVSPPGDLSLQPGSPLRSAGSPDHAPALDFLGNARPSPPSIGAYDVGSGSSSGGSSSGGSTGGRGGSRAGCGTSGEVPGALAGLMLLALLGAGRRARFRP